MLTVNDVDQKVRTFSIQGGVEQPPSFDFVCPEHMIHHISPEAMFVWTHRAVK